MVKRIKRTKRIETDFASPSAHPYPPQAAKIRSYPFHPFHPFSNPVALASLLPPLKSSDSTRQFVIRHSKNSSLANIHQFEDILAEKLWLLDTRPHAEASIRDQEKDYVSVDYFLYDRCCIVANGKEFYEEVLHDPSKFPTGLSFERLLSVADLAYERKTGKAFVHIPRKSYETYSNEAGWEDAD